MTPRLLDLFCGAGGCSAGYARAGFECVGVDNRPMPRYPFQFVQADALEYVAEHGHEFDAIHASPPCQRYTTAKSIHNSGDRHPDLVAPTRDALERIGKPWVIENVIGSPVRGIVLCGLMFGLGVLRHRLFETSFFCMVQRHPTHPKHLNTGTQTVKRGGKGNGYSTGAGGLVCVAGHNFVKAAAAKAMGIDWMTRAELAQAIPPAYTHWIGKQLRDHLAAGDAT